MQSNQKVAVCVVLALVLGVSGRLTAQVASSAQRSAAAPNRITANIDEHRLIQLRGNVHPLARAEFDRGLVSASLPLERVVLTLQRSPEQESALTAFMAQQYNPKSPNFHHWLTPEEFGTSYGPSDADIQIVTGWLQKHGFRIDNVSRGRVTIEFSGTAGQVDEAFHTEIHRYLVHGESHIANSSDPQIPAAIAPVVEGIASLHNFFPQPQMVKGGLVRRDAKTGKITPVKRTLDNATSQYTYMNESTGATHEDITPYDFAAIYNVLPLWQSGINGAGQTIAISALSDITLSDVATFQQTFGLPNHPPTVIHNGTDPGIDKSGGQGENTLDVEWSGAVAPGATIVMVVSQSTGTTYGGQLSDSYIVDNGTAPIMSASYGGCELHLGTSGNATYNMIWQQGATEGISIFESAGDQGSSGCEDSDANAPNFATTGLQVNGMASSPYVTAVGGTDFVWQTSPVSTYWNPTNNSSTGATAIGYIPEVPWNSTCTSSYVVTISGDASAEALCNDVYDGQYTNYPDLLRISAGSGGVSACTTPSGTTPSTCSGGYPKPSWQVGVGVPADGKRDLPDVSLFASAGLPDALDGSAYLICESGNGACDYADPSQIIYQEIGGTSASSPAMAGIMALVLQKVNGVPQGLANPVLYALAAQENLGNCNSNTVGNGSSCVFYDTTSGTIAQVCEPGTLNCVTNNSGDVFGVLSGYSTGTGYDQATGLGSVNAANLVNSWSAGAALQAITFSPSSLIFTSTAVGTASAGQTVNIENSGSDARSISITDIQISGADYTSYNATSTCPATLAAGASCPVTVTFTPAASGTLTALLQIYDTATGSPQSVALSGSISASGTGPGTGTGSSSGALQFVPVPPCRIADTRNPAGPFGGPEIGAGSSREFNVPSSACNIPSTALAYSLNVTAVPNGPLNYLTLWPSGQTQPVVSTLNSDGRVKANAAITPAGTSGGVSVFAYDTTNVVLDINGYFVPAGTGSALAFYPLTPCRVADTRNGDAPLGGPFVAAGSTRVFPVLSSSCGLPPTAQAYSLNVTAIPHSILNYLTVWPTGQAQPTVSTLNATTGAVTANAAMVPAGTSGEISIFVYDDADVVLDVNGYFAPLASGGLSLYTTTPCRVLDTRSSSGAFNGVLAVGVESSACAAPATAQAYILNATVVPPGPVNYLTLWPAGESQPVVSTLNAADGALTSNMAIVPTSNGSIDAFASNPTQLLLDLSSYFAP